MSKTSLWIVTVLLFVGAIYILFIMLPGRQSKLAKEGVTVDGTVQMVDQRPGPDGSGSLFFVTLIYKDNEGKNHQVTRQMFDAGAWEGLKANQDIKVHYLPSDADNGSIPGAEGMTTPRAGAFKFLAYTFILAAFGTGFLAFRAAESRGSSGPIMSNR